MSEPLTQREARLVFIGVAHMLVQQALATPQYFTNDHVAEVKKLVDEIPAVDVASRGHAATKDLMSAIRKLHAKALASN